MAKTSFTNTLSSKEKDALNLQLELFVVQHAPSRPLALVTSGGTSVNVDGVRSLENFSTGTRGAACVEMLLERGYAVAFLQRTGSATPFERVLRREIMENDRKNSHLLDGLFADPQQEEMMDAIMGASSGRDDQQPLEIRLHRHLVHSSALQKALRQHKESQHRLLTIPFTTVEDYLNMLQLTSRALADVPAMIVLAAAVSDFTVTPQANKIQSHGSDGLVLELRPVPKVIPLLRNDWAPRACLVTFKLETDPALVEENVKCAFQKTNCHVVVANVLATRHDTVQVWRNSGEECIHLQRSPHHADSLEAALADALVEHHFEFLSHTQNYRQVQHELWKARRRQVQRQYFWKRCWEVGVEVLAAAVAMGLSYTVNQALQRRAR